MFKAVEITTRSIFNCVFWFIVSIIVILLLISYAFAISRSLIPGKLAIVGPIIASIVAFIFYKLAVGESLDSPQKEPEIMMDTEQEKDIIVTLEDDDIAAEHPVISVEDTHIAPVTSIHTVSLSTNMTPCSPLKNNFLLPPLPVTMTGSRLPPVMSPFSTQSVLSLQSRPLI